MTNNNAVYEGGAQRSDVVPMYRRVEWDFLRRVAEALTEGAEKYPDHEDGVENWKHGQKEFAKAAFDHVIEHLYKWKEGEGEEDHLGHAGAGLMFLMYFEREGVWDPAGEEKSSEDSLDDYDFFTEIDVNAKEEVAEAAWDREAMLGELAKTLSPVQRARLFFGLPLQKESN